MKHYPQRGLFEALEALAGTAYKACNAIVTGDVELGEDVGIWFGCVLRGDDAPLSIGRRTNIQDLTMIHADPGVPNVIGEEVTVGHRCVLHGARVGDRAARIVWHWPGGRFLALDMPGWRDELRAGAAVTVIARSGRRAVEPEAAADASRLVATRERRGRSPVPRR